MAKRKWYTGAREGQPAFPNGIGPDYPVDIELIGFNPKINKNKNPDPNSEGTGEGTGDGTELAKLTPEILTDLSNRIGTVDDSGKVDVVLTCTDFDSVVKYEVRIAEK